MEFLKKIKDHKTRQPNQDLFDASFSASEKLGEFYARNLFYNGARIETYKPEQEEALLTVFKEKVCEAWQNEYHALPTDIQLESLEEAFGRSFYMVLGSLSHSETHMRSGD